MRFKTILMMAIAAPLVFGIVTAAPAPAEAQTMTAQEVKKVRRDASRSLKQARNAVKKAERKLRQAKNKDGDVEAAQAELDSARADLTAAEQKFKDAMALQAVKRKPAPQPETEQVTEQQPETEAVESTPKKQKKKKKTEPEPVQAEAPVVEDEESEKAAEEQRIKDEERKKRRAERRKRLREQEAKSKSTTTEQVEIIKESEAVGTELDAKQARQIERLQKKLRQQKREIQRLEQASRNSKDEQFVRRTRDGRIIVKRDDQLVIRGVDDNRRSLRHARDVIVEDLPRGRTRTTIIKPDGTRVITVRDRYGDIVFRFRRYPNGREVVLIDNRLRDRGPSFSVSLNLPRLIVPIPRSEYIVELERADRRQLRETLIAPPVEPVERVYTLEEIRENQRVRDKVRSVNLNNVLFNVNSARISQSQVLALAEIGYAMEEVLIDNPDAMFFIEGHADAPGSSEHNLELSDRRAESVAIVLSENFDIPPENLITQGYGEELLLIPVPYSEPRNRRVTVRPITDLVRPHEG